MRICVVGSGYVGFSNALLFAKNNQVTLLEINKDKINLINSNQFDLNEDYIRTYIDNQQLNLQATSNYIKAYTNSDYIIICLPTNYKDEFKNYDMTIIYEECYKISKINPDAKVIIRSTINIEVCDYIHDNYGLEVYHIPEFLRESSSLYDTLHPDRIIVGCNHQQAIKSFVDEYQQLVNTKPDVMYMSNNEAVLSKLAANNYLAMRIAFFNEIDTFCMKRDLNSENVIMALGHDQRIGMFYNNPSFGYGGYCLPKDTSAFSQVLDEDFALINNIGKSNNKRMQFIVDDIISKKPQVVGVYRLIFKANSDNYRNSSIHTIINSLIEHGIIVKVYEPYLDTNSEYEQINLNTLLTDSDLIIANRVHEDLKPVEHKVYTRDVFNTDK